MFAELIGIHVLRHLSTLPHIFAPLTVWALSHLSIRYGGAAIRQNSGDENLVATVSTRSKYAWRGQNPSQLHPGRCDPDELTWHNRSVDR
jgi:hypothetical protein